MLDTALWLEKAQRSNMKVGERRRFPHTCGEGDPVLVTAEVDGLHAWCFRCAESRKVLKELSLAEKAQILRQRTQSDQDMKACRLPFDYTLDIPAKHAVWLYKASIRKVVAESYGIGWSPSQGRIILPVYDDAGELAFMQARRMEGQDGPKYRNSYGANAGKVLFQTRTIAPGEPFVIVTEDMLSAIRTDFLAPSAALCGVSLSLSKRLILAQAKTILMFLDPDKAGIDGSKKAVRDMQYIHNDVRIVTARDDPKRITHKEIREAVAKVYKET